MRYRTNAHKEKIPIRGSWTQYINEYQKRNVDGAAIRIQEIRVKSETEAEPPK